jgi:hypothetical protein
LAAHPAGTPSSSLGSISCGASEEVGSSAVAGDGVGGSAGVAGGTSVAPASPSQQQLQYNSGSSASSPAGEGRGSSSSGSLVAGAAAGGGYTRLGPCSDSGDESAVCSPGSAVAGESGISEFTDPLRRISVGEGEMSREVSSELPAAAGADGAAGLGLVLTEQEPPPPWADGSELYDR